MTATLYIDYGDAFASNQLTDTVGNFQSVISGPDLTQVSQTPNPHSYTAASSFTLTNFNSFYSGTSYTGGESQLRRDVDSLVERYYAPFDVTVVDLTVAPQLVNGHVVKAATSLADAAATLAENNGDPKHNDAYVFVGSMSIGGFNPLSNNGGIASVTDIGAANANDGSAVVFAGNYGNPQMFLGLTVAHEAGHTFGLKHTFGNIQTSAAGIDNALLNDDIMSYLSSQSGYDTFTRFPLPTGDGNTSNAVTRNAYQQMAIDDAADIGPGNSEYITGSGANDIITVTKAGPNIANVTIQAFDNADFTGPITVPGSSPATTTYSYNIDPSKPLLIDAGRGTNQIVLDASLGDTVTLRGMSGTTQLIVKGTNGESAVYSPNASAPNGIDGSASYGGSLVVGATNINFSEFNTGSSATVQNVASLTELLPDNNNVATLGNAVAGQMTLSGFTGATPLVPLNFTNVGHFSLQGGAGANSFALKGGALATGLKGIDVQGNVGSSTLTVDSSAGLLNLPDGVFFDGGSGQGTLKLVQTGGATQTKDTYSVGPDNGQGSDVITGPSGTQSIHFTNLAPVLDFVPATTAIVNGTPADNAINYTTGSVAADGLITIDNQESFEFSNKTNLVINGAAGSDTINLNNQAAVPTGLTSITVNGNDPTASDTLIVNGIAGVADDLAVTPTGAGGGTVSDTPAPTFVGLTFSGIEHLTMVGQLADADGLDVSSTAGNDAYTYSPGATGDAGTVTGTANAGAFDIVPVAFSGFKSFVSPLAFNIGGTDRLTIDGTVGDDVIGFSNQSFPLGGTFPAAVVNGGTPLFYSSGVVSVGLDALLGNDAFNLTGDGTAATVSMSATGMTITGGGLGSVAAPLTIIGAGAVNFNNGAGAITVGGTANADAIDVTPTTAGSAAIQVNGGSPLLNAITTGSLTIAEATPDGDTVTVHGGGGDNNINVVRGATMNVQVDGLLKVNVNPADIAGLVVATGLGADTVHVTDSAGVFPAISVVGGQTPASVTLNVTTTAGTTEVFPGPTPDAGLISTPGGAINYSGVAAVAMTGTGPDTLHVFGTTGTDIITDDETSVAVNDSAPIGYTGFANVDIFGQSGDDTLVLNGSAGNDAVQYAPTAADSVVTGLGAIITFNGISHLRYDGQGGTDDLTIATPAGTEQVAYTPGAGADSGTIAARTAGAGSSLVPLAFSHVGAAGSVTFTSAGGREDVLELNGTNDSDVFNVNGAADTIQVSNPTGGFVSPLLNTGGISTLELRGLAGDDQFDLNGPLPYTSILVDGGDPSASDVANLTGATGPVTVALADSAAATNTTITGYGGTVTLIGVEAANLDAGGNTLTINGTAGDDTLAATPTGANAVSVQAYAGGTAQNGQGGTLAALTPIAPAFNATNVSTAAGGFAIDGNGGGDTLFVEGGQHVDVVDVNDATSGANAVLIAGLLTVKYNPAMVHVEVDTLAGSDTVNIAPSLTTTFLVDGGDPIGAQPGDTINLIHPPGPYQLFTGPTDDSGGLKTPGGFQTVSWAHIETIINTGGGSPIITGTNDNDEITVIARDGSYNPANPGTPNPNVNLDGKQDFTVAVNDGPDMLFIDTPSLFLDGLSGNDDIVVREPAPNNAAWGVNVYVAGGAPAAGDNRLGDNIELETPGAQNITYKPNNALADIPAVLPVVPGLTLSLPAAGGGQFSDGGNSSAVTAVQYHVAGFYQSSAGGAENFIYAGEAAGDTLTYETPVNAAGGNLIYTPGAAPDAGAITGSLSGGALLTPLSFSNLGTTGTVAFTTANPGRTDHLNIEGVPTSAGANFSVAAAGGGTVQLSQLPPAGGIITVPITTASVSSLELDGLGGNDQFSLVGTLPYTNLLVNDGAVVNLTGAAGLVTVNLADSSAAPPTNTTITGYGGTVTLTDVDAANLDAGGNALTARGTAQNDTLTYTPTGATAGTFSNAGLNTTFNFSNATGAFTVAGGAGVANEVRLNGTAGRDLFSIVAATGAASVTNALGTLLKPVVLGLDVQILSAFGLGGQDTFQVTPAAGLQFAPNNLDNLLINVDGGSGGESNALVIQSAAGGALAANQFVVNDRYVIGNSGVIRTFTGAAQWPDINYTNVKVVSPNVASPNNLLVMGPDDYEADESQPGGAILGLAGNIQVSHATIFPNAVEFPNVPADQDFYTVTAQQTGTLDVLATFRLFSPMLLPNGGNLNLQVLDAAGNVIGTASGGAASFGAIGVLPNGSARVRIPAVAGQTYTLHVFGANANGSPNGAVVNGYDLSIVDTPAIAPFKLELSRSVPAGIAGAPDTGDLPPNAPGDDTGRTQFDDVTKDATPRIYLRLSDGIFLNDLPGNGTPDNPPVGVIPIPFSPNAATPGFRVAIFDGDDTQNPVGFASQVAGFPGLYEFDFPNPLADGVHNLTAEVQMVDPATPRETGFGGTSGTLSITIDTAQPPVAFGTGVAGSNTGLDGASDSGVNGQPATIVDRITNVSTPTLYGVAEANAIVRLYDDVNHDGVVDAGDVFLGQTTAVPGDGTNADPNGQWRITSNVDLNSPKLGFPLDGVRNLLATAEDLAGNVSTPETLSIFIDTEGPKVANVSVTGSPGYNLFLNKPATPAPTPLVNSLDVTFNDQPVRVGPDFVYPAVNPILASTVGNYYLLGQHTGPIAITSITFADSTAAGTPGMSVATLHFAAPLPDDRYTLTVSDHITDNPGNALDGEFNGGSFFSGNGTSGGFFVGSFTVDSRPEIGVYSSGTISLDINGNGAVDSQNSDANNRDAVVTLGFPTDRVFAGQFSRTYSSGAAPVVNGFDKLASYGPGADGNFRWLYDLSGVSQGPATVVLEPFAIDGLPVAGNFDGSPLVTASNRPPVAKDGQQVGLFDGKAWYFDVLNQGYISAADLAAPATATHPAGKLASDMAGLPFVGDFDGDGHVDLATYQSGVMQFDLSSLEPGHVVTGRHNETLDLNQLFPHSIPFNTVNARPVAADLDADGVTDFGLYVTNRTDTQPGTAQWYLIESNSGATAPNAAGALTPPLPAGNPFSHLLHTFQSPVLGGHDASFQFGDQFALPVIGNFDPPSTGAGSTSGTNATPATVTATAITNLYKQLLGRSPVAGEVGFWASQLDQGLTPTRLAWMFATSNEYRASQINQIYQQYLGRTTEPDGMTYWTNVWNATGGPEQVLAGVISSPEFFATAQHRYPGLSANAAWVTALYHDILGRDVETAGLNYWVGSLKSHDPASVALGFVTSDEYRLELIAADFQTYLGRPLDQASSQSLLQQMQRGLTQDQLLTIITSSDEYIDKK